MRGSPLLRTLVVLLILLGTAVPLWKLTHKTEAAAAIEDSTPAAKSNIHIELTFSRAPAEFQLLHLGKVIWEAKSPGETVRKDFALEFPKEGIDLEIKAAWPPGAAASAVRVSVTPGNGNAIEKSAWGAVSVDEVLTFRDSES